MLTHCFFSVFRIPRTSSSSCPTIRTACYCFRLFSCYYYCNCLYHITIIKDADSLFFSVFRIRRTSSSSCPTRRWLRSSARIAFEASAWPSTFPLTFLPFKLIDLFLNPNLFLNLKYSILT
jgi:hypothetical protein